VDELRQRLKEFHEEEGVSYKNIAKNIGVSTGVLYNFTSEIRGLRAKPAQALDLYLKEKGY